MLPQHRPQFLIGLQYGRGLGEALVMEALPPGREVNIGNTAFPLYLVNETADAGDYLAGSREILQCADLRAFRGQQELLGGVAGRAGFVTHRQRWSSLMIKTGNHLIFEKYRTAEQPDRHACAGGNPDRYLSVTIWTSSPASTAE
jgi:hypothetical protein